MKKHGMALAVMCLLPMAATAESFAKIDNDADVSACVRVERKLCKTTRSLDHCNPWHEENAARVGADTVVVVNSDKNSQVLGFIGKRSEVIADYYRCKNPEPIVAAPDYWDVEAFRYENYQGQGTTSIMGQAFLRQRGGGIVTCAGSDVYAIPIGPYFEGVMDPVTASLDERARVLVHHAMCDASGNFKFSKLPEARWRVVTAVVWDTAIRYENVQGGYLSKEVNSVVDPEPVYLTGADQTH